MSASREPIQVLTPRAAGGIAVLSITGAQRQARAAQLLRALDGSSLKGSIGTLPRLCMLCVGDEMIDQVLVLDRPQRQSLEIHLHGSPALLATLATTLEVAEVIPSPAEALLQAALSEGQLQLALEQMAIPWQPHLQALSSLSPEAGRELMAACRERSRIANCHVEALPLVLCGATNAGKSTLMNRLLFTERSLTGPQPGLTRDPVREPTALAGYPYLLIDTAGEGPALTAIDGLAQQRARQERARTTLRLLVVDGNIGPAALEAEILGSPCLAIRNKADLALAPWPAEFGPYLQISAEQQSPAELRELVGRALRDQRGLPPAGPVGGAAALDREQRAELEALS